MEYDEGYLIDQINDIVCSESKNIIETLSGQDYYTKLSRIESAIKSAMDRLELVSERMERLNNNMNQRSNEMRGSAQIIMQYANDIRKNNVRD